MANLALTVNTVDNSTSALKNIAAQLLRVGENAVAAGQGGKEEFAALVEAIKQTSAIFDMVTKQMTELKSVSGAPDAKMWAASQSAITEVVSQLGRYKAALESTKAVEGQPSTLQDRLGQAIASVQRATVAYNNMGKELLAIQGIEAEPSVVAPKVEAETVAVEAETVAESKLTEAKVEATAASEEQAKASTTATTAVDGTAAALGRLQEKIAAAQLKGTGEDAKVASGGLEQLDAAVLAASAAASKAEPIFARLKTATRDMQLGGPGVASPITSESLKTIKDISAAFDNVKSKLLELKATAPTLGISNQIDVIARAAQNASDRAAAMRDTILSVQKGSAPLALLTTQINSVGNASQNVVSRVDALKTKLAEVAAAAGGAGKGVADVGVAAGSAGGFAFSAVPHFNLLRDAMADISKITIGILAGQQIITLGKQLMDSVQAPEKLAESVRRMGEKFNLTAEQSSTLIFGVKRLDGETLDLETGLGMLMRRLQGVQDLSDGVSKTGQNLTKEMNNYGIAVEGTNGKLLPLWTILMNTADAFKKLTDEGISPAGLAEEMFGRTGQQLVPILSLGRDGITQLMAEAKKLGVLLSVDNVNQIHQAYLAHKELQSAVEGLKLAFFQDFAPALSAASVGLTNLIGDLQKWATENHFQEWAKGVAASAVVIVSALAGLVGAFAKAFASIAGIVISVGGLIVKALALLSPFHKASPSLVENVETGVDQINRKYGTLTNIIPVVKSVGDAIKTLNEISADPTGGLENLATQQKSVSEKITEGTDAIKTAFHGLVDIQPILSDLGGDSKKLEEVIKSALDDARIDLEDFRMAADKELQGAEDAFTTVKDSVDADTKTLDKSLSDMKDAAATELEGAQKAFDDYRDGVNAKLQAARDDLQTYQDAIQATDDSIASLKAQIEDLNTITIGDELDLEKQKLVVMQAQLAVDKESAGLKSDTTVTRFANGDPKTTIFGSNAQGGSTAAQTDLTTQQNILKILQDQHDLAVETIKVQRQDQVKALSDQVELLTLQRHTQEDALKAKQEALKLTEQQAQKDIAQHQRALDDEKRISAEKIRQAEKDTTAETDLLKLKLENAQKLLDKTKKDIADELKLREDAIHKLDLAEQALSAKNAAKGKDTTSPITGGVGDISTDAFDNLLDKAKDIFPTDLMDKANTDLEGFTTQIADWTSKMDSWTVDGGPLDDLSKNIQALTQMLDRKLENKSVGKEDRKGDTGLDLPSAIAGTAPGAEKAGQTIGEAIAKFFSPDKLVMAWQGTINQFINDARFLAANLMVANAFIRGIIGGIVGKDRAKAVTDAIISLVDFVSLDLGTLITTKIAEAFKSFSGRVKESLDSIGKQWEIVGPSIADGFMKGLETALKTIGATLKKWWNDYVIQPIKDELGISSPSKVTEAMGHSLIDGLLKGMIDGAGDLFSKIGTWVHDNIIKPIGDALGLAKGQFTVMVDTGTLIVTSIWDGFSAAAGGFFSKIGTWIHDNIVVPFEDGVKSLSAEMVGGNGQPGIAEKIGTSLLDGVKNGFGDIGKWFDENFAAPFKSAIHTFQDWLSSNPIILTIKSLMGGGQGGPGGASSGENKQFLGANGQPTSDPTNNIGSNPGFNPAAPPTYALGGVVPGPLSDLGKPRLVVAHVGEEFAGVGQHMGQGGNSSRGDIHVHLEGARLYGVDKIHDIVHEAVIEARDRGRSWGVFPAYHPAK